MGTLTGIRCTLFLLALFLIAGCGATADYRYYTLAPVPSNHDEGSQPAEGTSVLGVGPLTIPDYLDRPQIVTRTSRNELILNEYHRWAGSLANDTARVLGENLDVMLTGDGVDVVSWRRGIPNDYRVSVRISRFDVLDGREVVLKAQWLIYGKKGDAARLLRESDIRRPVSGIGYESLVEAMGDAVTALSRDIAAGVQWVKNVSEEQTEVVDVLIEEASPAK